VSDVYVFSNGGWSICRYPFAIDVFAQLGEDLYMRSGDKVYRVNKDKSTDTINGVEVPPAGGIQSNWLDMGSPGIVKHWEGFDLVATQDAMISVGFNQNSLTTFTTPYKVSADTYTGGIIGFPVAGPSFSVKIEFDGVLPWKIYNFQAYIHSHGSLR
jgi:hypothetical protein